MGSHLVQVQGSGVGLGQTVPETESRRRNRSWDMERIMGTGDIQGETSKRLLEVSHKKSAGLGPEL